MNQDTGPTFVPADNPVRLPEDDLLGRAAAAEDFARQVLELDASEGAAVGVFGPWGSGKTSFVNLARAVFERERVPVLEFNPWLFSGAEELAGRFLSELSVQMTEQSLLKTAGEAVGEYGRALAGPAGALAALLAGSDVGKALEEGVKAASSLAAPGKSIVKSREAAARALREFSKPIVVVLDDTDRLSAPEIREVFKLVRLTASLPHIIYILPCDRQRIEQVLDEEGNDFSGRAYLEKIVQLPYDLPAVPDEVLSRQTENAIEEALSSVEDPGPFDEEVWLEVHRRIVGPLIRNMRDIRRYAMAVSGTAKSLRGQVARADMLGLEAVRLLLPEVFERIPRALDALTVPPTGGIDDGERESGLNPQLQGLADAAGDRSSSVWGMIGSLFRCDAGNQFLIIDQNENLASRQLQERRVIHRNVLRFYLERVVSDDLLAFYDAERAFDHMHDSIALREILRELDPERLSHIFRHLCGFSPEFRPEHTEPAIVALLNFVYGISDENHDPARNYFVPFLVTRILSVQKTKDNIESSVAAILPRLHSLYAKMEVILVVGHRVHYDHGGLVIGMVSKSAARKFEEMWREEIETVPDEELASRPELARIVDLARKGEDAPWERLMARNSPELTFAVLRLMSTSGVSETERDGEHPTIVRLAWDRLIALYGGEETLKARIANMNEEFDGLKAWFEQCNIPLEEAEGWRRRALDCAFGEDG